MLRAREKMKRRVFRAARVFYGSETERKTRKKRKPEAASVNRVQRRRQRTGDNSAPLYKSNTYVLVFLVILLCK